MSFIKLPDSFKSWEKQHFLHPQLDPQMLDLLLDANSLTQRVIKYCEFRQAQFSVKVLKQETALPELCDARVLNMKIRQWAYLREVFLYCGDTPVVYAKTIIPLQTLTGKQRCLAFLGNRPLGAYLFSQPNLHRDPIEIAQINHQGELLWARRSAFYLQQKPLLVYEVFLSDLNCKAENG
ncbi:MAG: chorismate lyase [Pseudomonadota bacterium]